MRSLALSTALLMTLAGCDDHTEGVSAATVEDDTPAPAETAANEAAADEATGRQTLTIDAERSSVGFTGSKLSDSHDGSFEEFSGTIEFDAENVESSAVNVTIQMASVQTEPERLLNHLKSDDFFGVETHPTATFRSTRVAPAPEGTEDATHLITGQLALHGQTRTITFPANVQVTDGEVSARAEFSIDRQQFGITYPGMPDDLINDQVVIRFDVHAPRPSES